MKKTKIRAIGNSCGVTIPKAMLDRLQVREGDAVYLVERTDGIEVRVADPEFERSLDAAASVMRRYRNTLAELAK
ncbi:MAG: AbrB/MazE/SpoVT family DNA-binding domain-containing protein [Candidatus Omnitrophota bacterium]